MADNPLDCTAGQQELKSAAITILMGVEPCGKARSIVDNWRLKALAEAIRRLGNG